MEISQTSSASRGLFDARFPVQAPKSGNQGLNTVCKTGSGDTNCAMGAAWALI
jgi:hypothetical protein